MKVYHDEGYGVTDTSVEYFKELKGRLGRIEAIYLDADRTYSMQIESRLKTKLHEDYPITTLLSGVNSGYGGTGPTGTIKIIDLIITENTSRLDVTLGADLLKTISKLKQDIISFEQLKIKSLFEQNIGGFKKGGEKIPMGGFRW